MRGKPLNIFQEFNTKKCNQNVTETVKRCPQMPKMADFRVTGVTPNVTGSQWIRLCCKNMAA